MAVLLFLMQPHEHDGGQRVGGCVEKQLMHVTY